MNKKRMWYAGFSLIAVTLIWGCSLEPRTQIEKAQATVDSALKAEANKYAPELYNASKSLLDSSLSEVSKQKTKMFLSRSYKQANQLLEEAIKVARGAKEMSRTAINSNTNKLIKQAQTNLDDLKKNISGINENEGHIEFDNIASLISKADSALKKGILDSASVELGTAIKKIDSLKGVFQK